MEVLASWLPQSARVRLENYRADRAVLRGYTSFDRSRLTRTYVAALRLLREKQPNASLGDYLEFGVYHGTSLSSMYDAVKELGLDDSVRLFGFDSFEGLPSSAADEDDGTWYPGSFRSSMELTRANLSRWGVPEEAVTLIPGWFDDSLVPETRIRHKIERASVVMVDCDLYSSTKTALSFCEPLIRDHAVFVFDDWNTGGLAERNMGEKAAFDEFLREYPHFTAEELAGLNYKDKAEPAIFLVTRKGETGPE